MADVNRGNRPLSPFMLGKYYRFQLNSVTSILTRITGVALLLGALMVVWWLLAAASGPDYFATVDWFVTSFFGDLISALFTGGFDAAGEVMGRFERSPTAWRPFLWPIKTVLILGIVLMILQALAEFFRDVARIRGVEI